MKSVDRVTIRHFKPPVLWPRRLRTFSVVPAGLKALSAMMLLSVTGCTGLTQKASEPGGDERAQPAFMQVVHDAPIDSAPLSAEIMYQVLAAEVMVERGYVADAFEVIYPLARETRDVGLAERAFELSMGTYDVEKVGQATDLWLALAPDQATPWRAAYLMSLRAGQLDTAIEQWQAYRARSDKSLEEDILTAVQSIARSADAPYALGFFDYLLGAHPQLWQTYYGYGLLAAQHGQFPQSIELLNQALAHLPEDELPAVERQIHQLLSKVYLNLDSPQPGLEALPVYLQTHPDDWLVQERLARLEVRTGRLLDAQARYLAILEANPQALTSRLSLALLQMELGQYDQAQRNLQNVAQDAAYESVAHYYLGVLSQQRGDLEAALAYFEQVQASPYALDAQLHRSEIVFAGQGLDAALALLDRIELSDAQTELKVLRAKAIFYRAVGQWEASIAHYSRALELLPDSVELLFAQAVVLYEAERYPQYVANLQRVLELSPDEVEALNALGYYYAERGIELEASEHLLSRAVALAPDSYYVLDSMGWLKYQQGDYAAAEHYLQQALAIELDEEVLMHLIATQWQMGKRDEAQRLWRKHRLDYHQDPRYQSLLERLEAGEPIH